MTLKIFRGVWFLSMMAVFANLLYVYASLPETVAVLEAGVEVVTVSREILFYAAMVTIALVNALVYFFSKALAPNEDFRTWLNGLVITLNIFFIIGMSFVSLYNSTEHFDFSRIGFIIYGSVGLVLLWALGWPLFWVGKKLMSKESI
jgi:hypothetical protein